MSITYDRDAPDYIGRLVTQINGALEEILTRSLPKYTIATKPDATSARWIGRLIWLTDGAANKFVAISNGTAWFYLEGSAV